MTMLIYCHTQNSFKVAAGEAVLTGGPNVFTQ